MFIKMFHVLLGSLPYTLYACSMLYCGAPVFHYKQIYFCEMMVSIFIHAKLHRTENMIKKPSLKL